MNIPTLPMLQPHHPPSTIQRAFLLPHRTSLRCILQLPPPLGGVVLQALPLVLEGGDALAYSFGLGMVGLEHGLARTHDLL